MSGCLHCYGPLAPTDGPLHEHCSRAVFGTPTPPTLDVAEEQTRLAATAQLARGRGLTGVQKKVSADLVNESHRMVLRGALGGYIVKPQTEEYPALPENEALCMRLAEVVHLPVVPATLLRTVHGDLAYVTRRIDRAADGTAIQQEDMAQITERLTEDKYKGSHEQVARAIRRHSAAWRLDLVTYYRAVLFCFVIGNADAHLKNWSLHKVNGQWRLMPLYDLVATRLVIPEATDPDELCLMVDERRHGFTARDFAAFAKTIGLPPHQATAQLRVLRRAEDEFLERISASYLLETQRERLRAIVRERLARLT